MGNGTSQDYAPADIKPEDLKPESDIPQDEINKNSAPVKAPDNKSVTSPANKPPQQQPKALLPPKRQHGKNPN